MHMCFAFCSSKNAVPSSHGIVSLIVTRMLPGVQPRPLGWKCTTRAIWLPTAQQKGTALDSSEFAWLCSQSCPYMFVLAGAQP
eukprot:scaffold315866_cov34-Prasinocladus_malaysianus.AAC.2